jgi:hypothetical protein
VTTATVGNSRQPPATPAPVPADVDRVEDEPKAAFPVLDPTQPTLILLVGRKRSGKSETARAIYESYPFDKVVIDTNGDAGPPGDDVVVVTAPPPHQMPARDDGKPASVHYQANPLSESYREDLDRAISMALFPSDRPALIWWDEYGETDYNASFPSPHLRLALQQSRHYGLSALMCCPRPTTISPLARGQADLIFIYDVPNKNDRIALAETAGWPPEKFITEMEITKRKWPKHSYLLWDAREHVLHRCPPIPLEETA